MTPSAVAAAEPLPESLSDQLREAIAAGVCPGAALGVVLADGRIFAGWAGCQSSHQRIGETLRLVPGQPVEAETLWDLASLTKPMAVVTLICRELGLERPRLTLDSRLEELLPEARGLELGGATVASLLGHASGALAWADWYAETASMGGEPSARAAVVRARVLATPLQRAPGVRAVYSDVGFMALGWALEALYRQPLDQLFELGVRRPLGLFNASYRRLSSGLALPTAGICATEIWPSRCPDGRPLCGVVHDDNCAALDGVAGHAGLFACLSDVLTWASVWQEALSEGTEGAGFLDPVAARSLIAGSAAAETTWRLGWDSPSPVGSSAGNLASKLAFGHLGYTGTSVWLDPSLGATVVLLTNRVHPTRDPHGPIKSLRPRVHDTLWRWLMDGAVGR